MSNKSQLQPLQDLLDSVLSRLDVLEQKVGVSSAVSTTTTKAASAVPAPPSLAIPAMTSDSHPAVKAYNKLLKNSVTPLSEACDALGGMKNMGQLVTEAWSSLESIIAIASRAKKPDDVPSQLQPLLTKTQESIQQMQKMRLDRDYDFHCKALLESNAALSWILISPPPQTPVAFVKEAASSTEFWSNRIRKQYKGNDDKQIAFCDALKQLLGDLMDYIAQYHKTGLAWNPKGVSVAEAAVVVADSANRTSSPPLSSADGVAAPPRSPRPFINKIGGGSGGMANLVAELESKRTADGSSAATGLKHVTKDQQTWRKEFKGDKKNTVSLEKVATKKKEEPKKKLTGLPICEYQERGHKWIVEHQTKETTGGKVLTVDITDPKQQVYMFNCNHVTLQVTGGKLKSVILDKCEYCSVVFDTVISACEIVHCKKIEIQTTGVCPSFSIDQTEGCVVYLSKESVATTSFVTSQSTEMNVSFPDGEDQKEIPIPEQFVHKILDGAVTSEVSDVYH